MSIDTHDLIANLTALNEIADTLNRAVDVQSALDSALARVIALMGLETGWIFLRDENAKNQWAGRGYQLAAHHNLPPGLALHRAKAWKGGCDCQALCNREKLTEAYNEVRCSRLAEARPADRSGLVIHASAPLRSGDDVLGILNVAAPDWESFTPERLALLTNAGTLIGIALERARLFDLLRERRIDEQAALLDFSNQLLGRPKLDDLMEYLALEMLRLLEIDACAVILPADAEGFLIFSAAAGWRDDPVAGGLTIRDDGLNSPSRAMRSQLPVIIEDLNEEIVPLSEAGWFRAEGFRGFAVIPLISEDESAGALMIGIRRPRLIDNDEMRLLQLMANQAAIAIEGARLRQAESRRQRMDEELAFGRQIQLSMLPKACPSLPGWDITAVYQAARIVGGDFYDFFELPGNLARIGVLIADVADKGVPAALFMALSRTIIRTTALSGRGAAAALKRANRLILNDSVSDLFLSAFYGILEVETGRFLFANGGHNRPLWYNASKDTIQELRAKGIILGVFDEIVIEERRIQLGDQDVLVLYTDGVTEALDSAEGMFGTQRLIEVVKSTAAGSASEIANAIVDAYNRFTADSEQSDDVTFVVIKRTGDPKTVD
ncbi:MAG: SpoIIE family protein phosphatase [Anaerolineae bacterium]|nr:SpoIIE family protein phosphatase [Anaerolineae bacterium]